MFNRYGKPTPQQAAAEIARLTQGASPQEIARAKADEEQRKKQSLMSQMSSEGQKARESEIARLESQIASIPESFRNPSAGTTGQNYQILANEINRINKLSNRFLNPQSASSSSSSVSASLPESSQQKIQLQDLRKQLSDTDKSIDYFKSHPQFAPSHLNVQLKEKEQLQNKIEKIEEPHKAQQRLEEQKKKELAEKEVAERRLLEEQRRRVEENQARLSAVRYPLPAPAQVAEPLPPVSAQAIAQQIQQQTTPPGILGPRHEIVMEQPQMPQEPLNIYQLMSAFQTGQQAPYLINRAPRPSITEKILRHFGPRMYHPYELEQEEEA